LTGFFEFTDIKKLLEHGAGSVLNIINDFIRGGGTLCWV